MNLTSKLVETVVRYLPAADPDPLIGRSGALGQRLFRVDGPAKVRGEARYTAEHQIPGVVYAAPVHSTIAKGRIARIDVTKAEAMPGVLAILTHKNMPRLTQPEIWSVMEVRRVSASDLPVMQDDVVSWNGQVTALVVADSHERAADAASRVLIEYEDEPPALSFEQHLSDSVMPPDVLGEPAQIKQGDAEAELRKAEVFIDEIYRTPYYNHNAIEPHATIATWSEDGALTVYDSTQSVVGTQYSLAHVFGMNPENIRVISSYIGGGFGGKVNMWTHTVLCAAAARVVQRPVKFVLSREAVHRIVGGRTISSQRIALGSNRDGLLRCIIHQATTVTPLHARYAEQCTFPVRHLYASDSRLIEQRVVNLNVVANTWMRAPGESIGTFALESALDELSYKLSMDPIVLRRQIEPERDPTKGTPFSSRLLIDAYERGKTRFRWEERPLEPGKQRDGKWRIGQGVATAFYPYVRFPGNARVRITAEGDALVQTAAQEMGTGIATTQLQHAADRLGLPIDRIAFQYGDTVLPESPPAGGSAQTASIVAAVEAASEELHRELLRIAAQDPESPLRGASYDDVVARAAGLFLKDRPDIGETYVTILTRAGKDHLEANGQGRMPMELMQYSMASYGAQFCEVRVHEDTGEVRVSRWVGSFDCGKILNPTLSTSVVRGGIIMGIGMALTEEALFDERSGRIVNASLAEYHVPVQLDVPQIDVLFSDIPDPHAAVGARGLGEIGITGVAAAIANAVYHATGKRIRSLPITLDKLM